MENPFDMLWRYRHTHARTRQEACLNQPTVMYGRFDIGGEERVRFERLRFQFRMKLHADEPRMVRNLDDFRQLPIGRKA